MATSLTPCVQCARSTLLRRCAYCRIDRERGRVHSHHGGDAIAGIKKHNTFIKAADEVPSGAALRSAMKDVGTSVADKMALLAKVSANAVTKLTAANILDTDVVRLASRMISAKHFDDMGNSASDIREAPQTYRLEKDAEYFLRSQTPGALPGQIVAKADEGATKRLYGVLVEKTGFADEIKHGRGRGVGRSAIQVEKDLKILADPDRTVTKVTWHFFTNTNDTVGPDQKLLDLLKERGPPFVLWVA